MLGMTLVLAILGPSHCVPGGAGCYSPDSARPMPLTEQCGAAAAALRLCQGPVTRAVTHEPFAINRAHVANPLAAAPLVTVVTAKSAPRLLKCTTYRTHRFRVREQRVSGTQDESNPGKRRSISISFIE